MKTRLSSIIRLSTLLLLLLTIVGCEESKVSPQRQQEVKQVQPVKSLLDEPLEGAAVETTKNFYFVFDGSGSMADQECGGTRKKIDAAKDAMTSFLAKVPNDVKLGLYVFDDYGTREVVPLAGDNREEFIAAVNHVKAKSAGTPLAESIRFGVDKLVYQYRKQLGYGDFRLIVMTDGQATDLPAAVEYARKYKIPVHTIGFCIPGDHALRVLAISFRDAANGEDLQRGLEEVTAEIPFDKNLPPLPK